ncbi:MAG: glycoside hydrolase family 3 C-terminal domain-containing protein [Planctomycetota bacterium]
MLPFSQHRTPEVRNRIRNVLAMMTLEEKAGMLAGTDDWHLRGIPRLGIPSIRVADCGHGVSLCGDRASPATCFPTGVGMAATWNETLMERAGAAIGRETRALGCSIMLGPKINLHRIPLNGRCFETFAEDPVLAGRLAGALIRGIQSAGVAACVKAMAANNQQKDQDKVSATVDERTLRELYLRVFEIAIETGDPAVVMTSYNQLNGLPTTESPWMLKTVLKDAWRFDGFVVSDWRAVKTNASLTSGVDLEMPGPGKILNRDNVLRAVKEGTLTRSELDDKVGRLLAVIIGYGQPEQVSEAVAKQLASPENRAAALAVAEESITLLKNDNALLPLDRTKLKKLLVVGPNAASARIGGGGSASVTPFYTISPLDGIREVCGTNVEIQHLEGCSLIGEMEPIDGAFQHTDAAGKQAPGLHAELWNGQRPKGDAHVQMVMPRVDHSWGWAAPCPGIIKGPFAIRLRGTIVPPVSGRYRLGLHAQEGCISLRIGEQTELDTWATENAENFEANYQNTYHVAERDFVAGKPVAIDILYAKRAARAGIRLEWQIPGAVSPIERAVAAAREADAVIICTGISNMFEGGARDRADIDLPASQIQLIERIAAANKRVVVVLNNGGTLALPWEPQVPAIIEAWYPGQEGGRALGRILFGLVNPSGHLPDTIAHKLSDHASAANYPGDGATVNYREGLSIGYRHFDTAKIKPHFPFGFGLSYTTFAFSPPVPSLAADGAGTVRVKVRNTGSRVGKAVVQLYVRPIKPPVARPPKELKAFAKVELAVGSEAEVTLALTPRDFAYFDASAGTWIVAPGAYEILTGQHSEQLNGVTITIAEHTAQGKA